MRKASEWILVFFLLLVPASRAIGQTFGQITGTVTDVSGAVVIKATVTVTSIQTGASRSVETNNTGAYVFPNLLPGLYNIRVQMEGFQSKVSNGVELQVQQTLRQDFALEVGSVAETVEVSASAPLLNTEDATVGTVIENRQVTDLPLNGRNFIHLVSLSPNVSSDYGSSGGGNGRQGGDRSNQNFAIAGQRSEYNHYTLDGIVNQDVNFNTYAFLPSIDALQEFKVQTGVYSAEFGREAAQVNVSTKSGTNGYHGTVYEFLRNNAFDARPYAFTSVVPEKAPFKWNQFGFTLGGPVRIPKLFDGRDRLFFMSNYEGFRLRNQDQQVYSVPTAAMRNGDFSAAPVNAIRDPVTNQPFPNKRIPTNRFSTTAVGLLEFYPEPNIPGSGIGNNYLALQNNITNKDQFTQRIDFVESEKSFWFGRISWTDEFALAPVLRANGTKVETNVKQMMISNTRNFSPTIVNEFRFGATRFYNNLAQELQYERNIHEEFNIGLFIPPPIGWGLPSFTIPGFSNFGPGAAIPFTGSNAIFQWIDNVSIIRGNHSLKTGVELRRDRYNMIGTQEIRGSIIFDSPVTGYSFADYMLGRISRIASAGDLGVGNYRATSQAYFLQDTWRIRNNLTMDLGLRYEYTPPWLDIRGEQMNMWIPPGFGKDPNAAKPCFVRIGNGDPYEGVKTRFDPRICVVRDGRLGDRLVQDDKTNFAPRIGLAWSPTGKLTVRSGFGMFYVQDTTNPVFDMSRNIQGRITSISDPTNILTFQQPYTGGSNNPCGVQMPPQICVQAPQVYANQYDRRTPYVEQYLLNLQYQFASGTALEIGYFGNQGHRLQRQLTLNQPVPGLSNPILNRAPAPELGNWQVVSSVVHSNYHSFTTKMTHRLTGGLTGLVSYTWSKAIDNGSGIRVVGGEQLKPQQGDCAACERGLSIFDARHRFSTSFLYQLPVGNGRRFLNQGGVLNAFLGGWQLGGILRTSTGFPFTVTSGTDRSRTAHGYDRPNFVPGVDPKLAEDQRSPKQWFNVSAFQMNALGTFGNAGRNILIGPGVFNVDFSTLKNFYFAEGKFVQFRWEAFNALNHPNFAEPESNLSLSNWNLTGTGIPTIGGGAFGTINSIRNSAPMRKMQFALKIVF